MKWQEITIITKEICVEAISGIFQALGSGGVAIEDPQTARECASRNPQLVSPEFLDHDLVIVKGYFPEGKQVLQELNRHLETVTENFGVKCRTFVNEVQNEDWETSWKKYYHTFKIGSRLVIKPSWEEYLPEQGEIIIEIDPGMAFGTGIHASTRFCLTFLDEYVKGGEKVIDAGCGSGILSIAVAKLGASTILAMDIDQVAVTVAKENIILNQLQDKIKVRLGDIVEEIEAMNADIIVANITADFVEMLIPGAAKVLPAGGYFFGSGIVDSRWLGVKTELESHGFTIEKVMNDADWVGVVAVKN